jgi:hypothetical protein
VRIDAVDRIEHGRLNHRRHAGGARRAGAGDERRAQHLFIPVRHDVGADWCGDTAYEHHGKN